MNENNTVPPQVTPSAVAEASQWFALLHGPSRSPQADVLFRKWSQASPENEAAYDLVTQTWERSLALPKRALALPRRWQRAGFRAGVVRAVMLVAAAAVAAIAIGFFYWSQAGVHTAIGEQRTLTLEDNSRIFLNTDTQLLVKYDARRRLVILKKGEALFDVGRDASRPFVVEANGREVTALGTVFVIRSAADLVSVTLVEGKVSISTPDAAGSSSIPSVQVLEPGQRLMLRQASAPRLDRPEVEKVTAWRRGRIEMDHAPLYEAIAEMNRYSVTTLRVEQPEAQVIPITGSFRSGDVASFADTLVRACHLQRLVRKSEIVLMGMPSSNCQ